MKNDYSEYYGIKFWPNWLGLAILRLLSFLPLPILTLFGYAFGALAYALYGSRRKIALKNLVACFPEKNLAELKKINFQHFLFIGQAIFTSPINWWINRSRFERLVSIKGREAYDKALGEKRNIILLAPHFIAMEISGLLLQAERPMIGMYQYMKNPLINKIAINQRQRFCEGGVMFERKDSLRSILRELNKGLPMQYSPDQDAMRKGVFVPFFHPLASTTPALGKFAQATKAVIIPCYSIYKWWGMGYEVILGEPIENADTGDEITDATAMNKAIEKMIRQHPAQYLWSHKRFKTRPEGEAKFY